MNDRDMETQPYTDDENRVCKYLLEITHDQIGCGADPIGFLIASHGAINHTQKNQRVVIKALVEALTFAKPIVGAVVAKSDNDTRPQRRKVYEKIEAALTAAKELGDV